MNKPTEQAVSKLLLATFLLVLVLPSLIILNITHNRIQTQNELILEKLTKLENNHRNPKAKQETPTTDEQNEGIKSKIKDIIKDGFKFKDKTKGTGITAVNGMMVKIDYTGKFLNGKVFDTSKGKRPLEFILGAKMVVPGFEIGVLGMKVGGTRTLTIPPEMAYGDKGVKDIIPPNAVLVFEIELISATTKDQPEPKSKEPVVTNINNEELTAMLKKDVILIDIRRPEEWVDTGIVKGSHTITLYDNKGKEKPGFFKEFKEVVKDTKTPVILICRTGNRTSFAAQALASGFGYESVFNVEKGITDWISSGNKVEKYHL